MTAGDLQVSNARAIASLCESLKSLLKERGFSPAVTAQQRQGVLAPEVVAYSRGRRRDRHRSTGARPLLSLFTLLALLTLCAPGAWATIAYTVSLEHPEQHLFSVTVSVPVEGRELTTAMPAWNALYQIRDFAERIRNVTAACDTAVPLQVHALDKQTWRISSAQPCRSAQIRYTILWNTPGPFDSDLSSRHAFMNLAELLMYVPDRRTEDVAVQFTSLPSGWHTVAALSAARDANAYTAANYDALVDAPVEAGTFDEFSFGSSHALFHVVIDGKAPNKSRFEDNLRQLTSYELGLMRDTPFDPPSRDYTFIFHIGPEGEIGGGGMEHRNSTAIGCAMADECMEYAAHEFFHAWNVKRIRPHSLEPVDYSREQYTRALWFAEGVTSTYSSFALERSGLWSKDTFYRDLSGQIGKLQSRQARLWQSVEESSVDAWFEGNPDYNAPDRSISYYNKGQILGVLLDLAIRDATDNHKSLDDVMRRMNDEYAKAGKYYDDSEGVRAVAEEVTGKSLEDFFTKYIAGTDEIPYNEFLSVAGLNLNTLPADSNGPRFSISELSHPTDRQRHIRDGFLHGTID
jgi:predicted metalloprotease with PDZ domain